MNIIPSQRHLFSIPQEVAYFNCAYYSPLLKESTRRLIDGVHLKNHPWERTPENFFTDSETIRNLSSDLFGGDADGYAILPAASYGLSAAARAIEPHLNPGDTILLLDEEFPSIVLPWRRIALEKELNLVTIATPEDGNWTSAILDRLDATVKVFALSTCHWTNGAYIDVIAIRKACDATGSILIMDATQSLGAMPFSVDDIRPDFLVAAGYKWLLTPYGFGIMYVSEPWRNARPLEESWLARDNAYDFTALANYSDNYLPGARRFDVGEKGVSTILPGAIAALEQIKDWGIENIAATLKEKNKIIKDHLLALGFHIPQTDAACPHMFGALLPDSYKGNLVSKLKEQNIYLSQRGKSIRFAPHLYNDENDTERLLTTIESIIKTV